MSDLTIKGLLEEREEHFKEIDSIDAELEMSGVYFCIDNRFHVHFGIENVAKALGVDLTKDYFDEEYPYLYRTGKYFQIESEELPDVDL